MRTIVACALASGAALLSFACTSPPPELGGHEAALGAATTPRPLVTILTNFVAPTAPASAQWTQSAENYVNGTIPDNSSVGVSNDIGLTDIQNGSCSALFGLKAELDVTHPRPADLVVTFSVMSRDGATVLNSKVVFNGPQQAKGKTQKQVNAITLPSEIDVSGQLNTSDCARFRLSMVDQVAGQVGEFNGWSIKRRTALYPWKNNIGYFQTRLFGALDTTPNVADFYREESRGHFTFTNAGIIGPVDYPNWQFQDDPHHHQNVVWLLEASAFNFAQYDTNHDGRITDDELELLAFDNSALTNQGANRPAMSGCDTLKNSSLRVCSHIAFLPEQTDFRTLCHELSHSLGTVDLYGIWNVECNSNGLTLMSCTGGAPNSSDTLFHDPWHRTKLGWMLNNADPGWYNPDGGSIQLGDETWTNKQGQPSAPVQLINPNPTGGAASEYYLFEYRMQTGYDLNVASIGIVAWHVQENASGNPWTGPNGGQPEGHAIYAVGPDNPIGGSQAWTPTEQRFQLQWADGTVLPYTFWVEQVGWHSNVLHWLPAPANDQPPAVQITAPADGSSGTYGFGNNVVFTASVVDQRGNPVSNPRVDWVSDVDGPIGNGAWMYYAFGTPGARVITATGYDQYGAHASATVHYTATLTGPTASILAPTAGQKIYRNQLVELNGNGSTPTIFSLSCDHLTWTLDLVPGYSRWGCDFFDSFDVVGSGNFTLTVIDDYNQVGTAQVPVTFARPPKNSPPIDTITAPTSTRFLNTDVISASGIVTDPQGGPVSYSWTVYDEATGQESWLSSASSFTWTAASVGIYGGNVQLRLYGTNQNNQQSMVSEELYIDAPAQ